MTSECGIGDLVLDYATARASARLARASSESFTRPAVTVALGGSTATTVMEDALVATLSAEGFSAEIHHTPYMGWAAEALAEDGPDVWVIWLASLGLTRGGTRLVDPDWEGLAAGVRALIKRRRRVIVVLPEPLVEEIDPLSPAAAWRRDVIARAEELLPEAVIRLDLTGLLLHHGLDRWHDPRYWERAKMPASPDAASATGELIGRVIARLHRPRVRAVAVDLDGTLWGGILSEVGPDGIELDPDGRGRPFLELQRYLKGLQQSGVPLAIVSKNDPEIVREVFARRTEMVLALEDFIDIHASWEPKHLALADFAGVVNVDVSTVCFIDDSPLERDEARSMLPGLIVPELAEDPNARVSALAASGLFLRPVVDEADRLRTQDLKARRTERAEKQLREAAGGTDSYLKSLEMRLDVSPIDDASFDRALSLLHKTNQFNVTLWRPSAAELHAALSDGRVRGEVFRLVDRVADSGVISVLFSRIEETHVEMLAWVLSCRVFGRGVEWAVAGRLADHARDTVTGRVIAPYRVGPRNGRIPEVLSSLGLESEQGADAEGAEPMVYSGALKIPPTHVTLIGA